MIIPGFAIRRLMNGSADDSDYAELQAWLDTGGPQQAQQAVDQLREASRKAREATQRAETAEILREQAQEWRDKALASNDEYAGKIRSLRADLAAAVQRAEEAETTLAAMRTEHGRLYVKWEDAMQSLRAERQRAEAAEKDANELRADNEMNAHYATRALHAEAALAAVPVDAIRRYFEHSDAYRDVRNGKYEPEQGLLDCQSIAEWLDQQLEPTP